MLSKSLIQFSVEWWGCVPSLLFDLRPNYGVGNEENGDLLQKVQISAPNPAAGHPWPTPPLESPGHSRARLGQSLMGSLLLSPRSWCPQGSVCALQESVSPILCKFWCLCGGVNGDLLQEGLAHTQVCCTQSPCSRPLLTHLYLLRRHSDTVLAQSLWDLWSWCAQAMFEPSEHLWQVWGLILNVISPLLPSCWGFSFALGCDISPHSHSDATQLPRPISIKSFIDIGKWL